MTDEDVKMMEDAARFRWLEKQTFTIDTVSNPDGLVEVWHFPPGGRPVTAKTLRKAVDLAMRRRT